MLGVRWLEDFASDARYAWRQAKQHKGFYALGATTLALGIGANTAIFSAVNGVLLRPFPYRQPERLASLWCAAPSKGIPRMGCALPDLREIAARNRSFEGVADYYWGDVNITAGTPERVIAVYASANLFALLGVHPALGRTFTAEEETFGRNRVVVLSDALRRERLARVGGTLRLNGEVYSVIGVMPPDFQFPVPEARLWLPMSFAANDDMATRDNHFMSAIARLKSGVNLAQARADVESIGRLLERTFSQNAGLGTGASDYASDVVGDVRPALLILLAAAGVVLLIACGNVANLLLSRASARRRELSLRAALGASRGRLVRQLCGESILLGGAGACLGVAAGAWLVPLIRASGPPSIPRLRSIELDGTVLAFAAGAGLLSVALFGLAPAVDLIRARLLERLQGGGRNLTAGWRSGRFRDGLVIAEITLSLVLTISAGLLLETLRKLRDVDPGCKTKDVLTMSVTLPQARYPESDPAKAIRFFDELTRRLARIPGVEAAGGSTAMPITPLGGWGKYFTVEERPAARLADVPVIQYRQVTPGLVRALGVPVQEGRFFTADDTAAGPLVAVINESARRRYFPHEDPIGKRVFPNPPEATIAKMLPSPGYRSPRLTIVGVIGDTRDSGLSRPVEPALFVPHLQGASKGNQTPANKMFLFLKAKSDPLALVNAARSTVRSLDPEQPVADVATMDQRLERSLAMERFQFDLFGGFAAAALLLAAVGIYGVLSYSVRLRMHEIGIRMALGANTSDVVRMVMRRGLGLGAAGIALGACLAWGVTRLMSSLLYGVQATDTATFLGAALVLMAVAAGASLAPSLRAARTDALEVLRME